MLRRRVEGEVSKDRGVGAAKDAAGYGDEAVAVLFYCVGDGDGSGGNQAGLGFLSTFYLGCSLNFRPMLLMIMLTLVGCFMAFTGIILHSMSRLVNESRLN